MMESKSVRVCVSFVASCVEGISVHSAASRNAPARAAFRETLATKNVFLHALATGKSIYTYTYIVDQRWRCPLHRPRRWGCRDRGVAGCAGRQATLACRAPTTTPRSASCERYRVVFVPMFGGGGVGGCCGGKAGAMECELRSDHGDGARRSDRPISEWRV